MAIYIVCDQLSVLLHIPSAMNQYEASIQQYGTPKHI